MKFNDIIKSKSRRCAQTFEKYYLKLIDQPTVKRSKDGRAITAAYLFSLQNMAIAFGEQDIEQIQSNAYRIALLLREKLLSASEIALCDKLLDVFAGLARTGLSGVKTGESEYLEGVIFNLKMRYFHLIKNPECVNDYGKSFIDFAREYDMTAVFTSQDFKTINDLTDEYMALI